MLFTKSLTHGNLASSFVCGTPLSDHFTQQLFIQTGLIHLMVVSGSHLIFVSQLISLIRLRRISFGILTIYSFITGFQAPVVRSLAGLLVQRLSHYFRWNWDHGKSHGFASLLLLAMNPLWIQSFSFYLSWLAASGLALAPLCFGFERNRTQIFLRHTFSCFSIQTLIAGLAGSFSVLSWGMNVLIAPLVGVILFPASLLGILIPAFHPWLDQGWGLFVEFLAQVIRFFPAEELNTFDFTPRWYFLAFFISACHFLRKKRYENSAI